MDIEYNIPDCENGDWKIETFDIEKDIDLDFITIWENGEKLPKGRYKRLLRGKNVIMSNTPNEIKDFIQFIDTAKGNVLISGLGMGLVLSFLLSKKEVESITVLEISKDLIDLISPHVKDDRVKIIHADAFKWHPPKNSYWEYAWHDIWDNTCSSNIKEMKRLKNRYKKYVDYQECWGEEICEIILTSDIKFGII